MKKETKKIVISKDGPYLVSGNVPLDKQEIEPDKDNIPHKWKKIKQYSQNETTALCRCGKSNNPPYCDGTHIEINFKANDKKPEKYSELAENYTGKLINLADAGKLCAGAGFCHRKGTTWELINKSDLQSKKEAIHQCSCCPSGRLVAIDKKGKPIEPKLNQEITITEDSINNVSGPLWVKGGIEIESSNGEVYEKRNSVTLCRCGKSKNKPLCDGSHISCKFKVKD